MEFWTFTATAAIGAAAWIYQRTWERLELRRQSYGKILALLPAFFHGSLDPLGITSALNEFRSMLLFAPDNVIRAAENFIDALKDYDTPDGEKEQKALAALNELVITMRKDCTFKSAVYPGLWSSKLTSTTLLTNAATGRQF